MIGGCQVGGRRILKSIRDCCVHVRRVPKVNIRGAVIVADAENRLPHACKIVVFEVHESLARGYQVRAGTVRSHPTHKHLWVANAVCVVGRVAKRQRTGGECVLREVDETHVENWFHSRVAGAGLGHVFENVVCDVSLVHDDNQRNDRIDNLFRLSEIRLVSSPLAG